MKTLEVKILFLWLVLSTIVAMADNANEILHRNPFLKPIQSEKENDDLSQYALATLKLTGTIQNGNESLAVIKDAKNHLYYLKINELIGLEKAKIVQILSDQIEVEWISDGKILTDYLALSLEI